MTAQPERTIPFGRPDITDEDRAAVLEVLNGHILTHGPNCKSFETEFSEYVGGGYAVTVNSCMTALHLASWYFGLGEGDEVIVPAQSHVATVSAVEIAGATPVFVDCYLETGNMIPEQIAQKITPRTKAISVVHFNGIPAEMDAIVQIAKQHNLILIEDCALSLGATYKGTHVGLIGDVGCFSFYPAKHITTGEGGMYLSKNETTATQSAHLRAHGVDRQHNERKIPGKYEVTVAGSNYRMSEMQAALGRSQLKRADRFIAIRQENFTRLKAGLLEGTTGLVILDAQSPDTKSSYYCLSVVLPDELRDQRDNIALALNAAGVGTSIYYPKPIPQFEYYQNKYGDTAGQYPNAERISYQSIALPVGQHLNTEDMDYIADQFKRVLKEFV